MDNEFKLIVVMMGQYVFDRLQMSAGRDAIHSTDSVICVGAKFCLDTSLEPYALHGTCSTSDALVEMIVRGEDLFSLILDSDDDDLKRAVNEIVAIKNAH